MRGLGDSKTPLYFVGLACVINIVLDLILVGYFHWGATGAAIATVTAPVSYTHLGDSSGFSLDSLLIPSGDNAISETDVGGKVRN